MEIIMKVKCSPTPGAGAGLGPGPTHHSSLKIVDHHRQLQQHTGGGGYRNTNTSPQIASYIPPPSAKPECPLSASSCAECTVGYCCNLQTCCLPTPHVTLPTPPPLLPIQTDQYTTSNNISLQQQTAEDQPEFVSIEDEKVKEYLMKFGQQRKLYLDTTKLTRIMSVPPSIAQQRTPTRPIVYEIIELDDEGEREKLKQIKEQAEQSLANKKSPISCIDMNFAARHTKSLNISLIPKPSEKNTISVQHTSPLVNSEKAKTSASCSNQKIIAEINLIDSSDDDSSMDDGDPEEDDDEDDDDETLPLAAVSCELDCDDDDVISNSFAANASSFANLYQVTKSRTLSPKRSDGSTNENLLIRWEEYEGQRERVFFECFLCGKKVQSSYNLRRHMMIHTGERPFACDMCDRRFREFSDLKKHRRRHSTEPNFICMVCREFPPVENDPTRCIKCCTQSKNAVLMAAMKTGEEESMLTAELDVEQTAAETNITSIPTTTAIRTPPPATSTGSASLFTTITNLMGAATTSPRENLTTPQQTSSGNNSTSSEDTQRLLDNIPAVHRPGHNQLGMITRKEFPCPLCNRAFGTRHNLKRHYMIHTGEKPFSCTKCRKPFREYSTLKKHMVTHQRDRWYKCMRCPLKFRDFLKYTEHKESHPHEDDESEELPEDASSSKSRSKYKSSDSYMDSNDEDSMLDDWLECCECGQRFNEIDTYNAHLEKHSSTHKPEADSDDDTVECI